MADQEARREHPSVAGRAAELRALTDAVRRLVDLAVTHVAPAEQTAALAADLNAIADRMQPLVPDPVPARYQLLEHQGPPDAHRLPYDVVLGPMNPIALPVTIELDPPRALGRACFTTPYEGPPGCVHGAVIAGAFDMVLTAANQLMGAAGPTARLSIRYRRPTLLFEPLTFEAEVVQRSGRRTSTVGRITQDGVVTAEAEGLFVALDRDQIAGLRARR